MGKRGAVQFMSGTHHFRRERCGRIAYERYMIAEFHRKPGGGFDAGVRKQANSDDVLNPVLL
jgi:hypothetical protein